MKVILSANPADARAGYVHIKDLFSDLGHTVDGGEATEIIAYDILDQAQPQQVVAVLENWLSKLTHGGTLTLSVVDLREVARAVIANVLNFQDVCNLLHINHRVTLEMQGLLEFFNTKGVKVLKKFYQDYRAHITVQRP